VRGCRASAQAAGAEEGEADAGLEEQHEGSAQALCWEETGVKLGRNSVRLGSVTPAPYPPGALRRAELGAQGRGSFYWGRCDWRSEAWLAALLL